MEDRSNKLINLWIVFALVLALVAGARIKPTRAAGAGLALDFDGVNDYVALGDTGDLMVTPGWISSMSLSLWVRPTGATAPVTAPPSGELIAGADTPRLFGINRAVYNGQDKLWVWNADNNGVDIIGVNFTPGEWMQIALVHTGGVLYAYKNGSLVGSVASGDTAIANTGTGDGKLFLAGSGRSGEAYYIQGQIDEVSFWNVGLDAGTLQAWWNQEVTSGHPDWANLAAYYQMTDGAGTSLTDNSGHGRTGTLNGGMSDANWVASGALGGSLPTNTPTPTSTSTLPTPTSTNTPTVTATSNLPSPTPTQTPTQTPVLPTNTATFTPSPTATRTNTPTPTRTNTPTPTQTPPSGGYALQFDGNNDFVQLNKTALMMGPGWQDTKTVSLWVLPTGSAPACQNNSVAFCDAIFGDRPRWWGIARGVIMGTDRIWVFNTDNSPGSFMDTIAVSYTPGEWVHIALVHQNGVMHVYKNGVEVGAVASGTTVQPNTGAQPVLHLGGIINNTSRVWTFQGQLDEVQIWSIARSAAQIQQVLFQPLVGNESGLAAYYRMSNGSGTILTDDSVNSWDGTLLDGANGVPPDGSPPKWVSPGVF